MLLLVVHYLLFLLNETPPTSDFTVLFKTYTKNQKLFNQKAKLTRMIISIIVLL